MRQPCWRCHGADKKYSIKFRTLAVCKGKGPVFDPCHLGTAPDGASDIAQRIMQQPGGTGRHFGDKSGRTSKNRNIGSCSSVTMPASGKCQCQFTPRRAAANDGNAPGIALADKIIQPVSKTADRFDRDCMLRGAVNCRKIGPPADID